MPARPRRESTPSYSPSKKEDAGWWEATHSDAQYFSAEPRRKRPRRTSCTSQSPTNRTGPLPATVTVAPVPPPCFCVVIARRDGVPTWQSSDSIPPRPFPSPLCHPPCFCVVIARRDGVPTWQSSDSTRPTPRIVPASHVTSQTGLPHPDGLAMTKVCGLPHHLVVRNVNVGGCIRNTGTEPRPPVTSCHCEERSDVAIQRPHPTPPKT
jgi:hypothetical protein